MLLSRQFGSTMAKRKSNGGGGLLMILSPAKTLDLSPIDSLSLELTTPDCDSDKTKQVAGIIKKKKKIQLPKVLGISPKLAETAFEVRRLSMYGEENSQAHLSVSDVSIGLPTEMIQEIAMM